MASSWKRLQNISWEVNKLNGKKTYTGIAILVFSSFLGMIAPELPGWLVPILQTAGLGIGGAGVVHKADKFVGAINLGIEAVKAARSDETPTT